MEKLQNPRMDFLQQSKQRHLLSSPPSQVVSHGSLKDLQQQGFLGFHLSFQIFFYSTKQAKTSPLLTSFSSGLSRKLEGFATTRIPRVSSLLPNLLLLELETTSKRYHNSSQNPLLCDHVIICGDGNAKHGFMLSLCRDC